MFDLPIVFIGEFPPPYGGVTVKDQLVFQKVLRGMKIHRIDLVECKRKPYKIPVVFCKILVGIVVSRVVIIGVGTTWRRKLLLQLQQLLIGSRGMKKTMLLVMGGQFHKQVAKDHKLKVLVRKVGSVWVETEEMHQELINMGVNQTYIYPNPRSDYGAKPPNNKSTNGILKLVFFSRICEEKGIDTIMKASQIWDKNNTPVSLDFYGEVSQTIKERFFKFLEMGYRNTYYHGVFDAVNQNVYEELNNYDIMLLPTRWDGEGISGALIESKMAGITAIVSDWNVNRETVRDGQEGIVLKSYDAEELAETVMKLCDEPEMVQALKEGAFTSRKRYNIDTYRNVIIEKVLG